MNPADIGTFAAGCELAADRAGSKHDGELLSDLTIAGVEDNVLGVGAYADYVRDLTLDASLFPGLSRGRLARDSPRSIAAPGMAQLSLSGRRISKISPTSLVTTTSTEGTRLLGLGAAGSS